MSALTTRRLAELTAALPLPVVAAPMTRVSGPEIVGAACAAGIIGSMPVHNAASTGELDAQLTGLTRTLGSGFELVVPNLVVHRSNTRLTADLECLADHRVSAVIASVGSPDHIVEPLHRAGIAVLADVATVRHADRAAAAGVDGLVLLTAGAGGQTGAANPFAFLREVRRRFGGTLALAGGLGDGRSILAARIAGADLAYLGTRFLATTESRADADYRAAVMSAGLDDVRLTAAVSGLQSSILDGWLDRHHDPNVPGAEPRRFSHEVLTGAAPFAWSAGHAVGAVTRADAVADVVTTLIREYDAAATLARTLLDALPVRHH